jgi:hypothetical protein
MKRSLITIVDGTDVFAALFCGAIIGAVAIVILELLINPSQIVSLAAFLGFR